MMNYGNGEQRAWGGGLQAGREMTTPPPPPNGSMTLSAVLDAQAKALYQLHEIINALESRLQPALAPVPPAPATGEKAQAGDPHLFIDRVALATRVVESAAQRLGDLVDRLQF